MKLLLLVVLACSLTFGQGPALVLGAASSDNVNCGSASGIDDPSSYTVAQWVYPTTLSAARHIISKSRNASNEGWRLLINNPSTTNLEVYWDRATTDQSYVTNDGRLTTNKWWFIAATASASVAHIYMGDLSTLATESTYGTTTVGSGTQNSAATRSFLIGNMDRNVAFNLAFQGSIAVVGYWHNETRSLVQLQAWQFKPKVTQGGNMKIFVSLGQNGTGTQADWTGSSNNCTVVGATAGTGVPLGPMFGAGLYHSLDRWFTPLAWWRYSWAY